MSPFILTWHHFNMSLPFFQHETFNRITMHWFTLPPVVIYSHHIYYIKCVKFTRRTFHFTLCTRFFVYCLIRYVGITTCQMHDYRHQLQTDILSWVIIPFWISCLCKLFSILNCSVVHSYNQISFDLIVYAQFFSCCILLFGCSVNIMIIIFVQRLIQYYLFKLFILLQCNGKIVYYKV